MSEFDLPFINDSAPMKLPFWSAVCSAQDLLAYLTEKGLVIDHTSGMDGRQNCIYLPDKTSFNWKAAKSQVRINCRTAAKLVIEQKTPFTMMCNGKGDTVRDYSLLLDNQADLDAVIDALKSIEGNA